MADMPSTSSIIVSRLVLVVGLLAASGAVYWFLHTTFAPVEILLPSVTDQSSGNMRFDPRSDVSKNPAWGSLRPLTTQRLEPGEDIGRSDPFSPVPTSSAYGANGVPAGDANIYIGGNTGMPTPSSLFPAAATGSSQEGAYAGMAPPVFPTAATDAPPEVYGR